MKTFPEMIFTAIYCICEKHIIYIFFEFTIKLCLLGYASRILQGLVNPGGGAKVKKHAHTGSTPIKLVCMYQGQKEL